MNFVRSFLLLFIFSSSALAFDPTAKTINVVIPFTPGGGVDATFRHFEKWAQKKGLNFSPIYKPGAEGLIGMNEISKMPGDGYHVSFATAGAIATQRTKNPSAELETITLIKSSISGFITHKDSGIKSFNDLYSGNESKTIGFGAPGQRAMINQMIKLSDGKIKATLIPYKGGSPLVQDIAGNHVQFALPPLLISKSFIDAGNIKLIAVGSKKRLKDYPDVPTIYEFLPNWQEPDGFVFVLPKDTSIEAVKFWNNILREYMDDSNVKEDFVKEFNEPKPFGKFELEKMVTNLIGILSFQLK